MPQPERNENPAAVPSRRSMPGKPASVSLRKLRESGVLIFLGLCGFFTLLVTVGIVATLFGSTKQFLGFRETVSGASDLNGHFATSDGKTQFVLGPDKDGITPALVSKAELEQLVREKTPADSGRRFAAVVTTPQLLFVERSARPATKEQEANDVRPTPQVLARIDVESFNRNALTLAGPPPAFDPSVSRIELNHRLVTTTEFLTGGEWNPKLGAVPHFGVWPLVIGTLTITVIAIAFAGPLGLVTAIWLSEYAPRRVRDILKPILEILAGIPTVVLGFFALTVITPLLRFDFQSLFGGSGGNAWNPLGIGTYNVLSAGIAVGILTLPIIVSLTEDALRSVPRALREGSFGLGATRFETSIKVVTPAALSGIVAAFLLAIARCVGETMIVALAAGQQPIDLAVNGVSALDPRGGMLPMTGYLVLVLGGDISNFGIEYFSLYAVAAVMFVLTFVLTIVGHLIRVRFQQQYE
jgi:phosphate transport system permease protein